MFSSIPIYCCAYYSFRCKQKVRPTDTVDDGSATSYPKQCESLTASDSMAKTSEVC